MILKNLSLRYLWNALILRAPIMAQLIVTRRCNLSCGYCTEYDNFSPPIPLEILKQRIDALHRLKTISISLLGGEPLLHPQLCEIISHAATRSLVSLTTNGSLLSKEKIEELNKANLKHMQVSIDSMYPTKDLYIQKNFNGLKKRLLLLKEYAKFKVQINCVFCPQIVNNFHELVDEVNNYGFTFSIGLLHDNQGQIQIQGEPYQSMWEYAVKKSKTLISLIDARYGSDLLAGKKPDWKCRAGQRYLYIDENGKVQFCSAKRGHLNKDLLFYTAKDLKHYGNLKKGCEKGCSINCVYRTSYVDNFPKEILKIITKR